MLRAESRSGNWTSTFGSKDSKGPLVIHVLCVDGFEMSVTWIDSSKHKESTQVGCDGNTLNFFGDKDPAVGPVTVSVSSTDRTTRWSLQAARG